MNCAPPELLGGTLLPQLYAELDARRAARRARLVVEVTEDSFMTDPERARERLLELRAHGVQIAIDDYGTGFSSLAYLRDLPVQELKIDRSFVTTMRTDARSRVIVDTTRQMAHAMGLRAGGRGRRGRRDGRGAGGHGHRHAAGLPPVRTDAGRGRRRVGALLVQPAGQRPGVTTRGD